MPKAYTESAERILHNAGVYASTNGASEIGSEHLLLSLLHEDKLRGKNSLIYPCLPVPRSMNDILRDIQELGTAQKSPASFGKEGIPEWSEDELPDSVDVERIRGYAAEEAGRRKSTQIDLSDIACGFLNDTVSTKEVPLNPTGKILLKHGVTLAHLRAKATLSDEPSRPFGAAPTTTPLEARSP